jgi:peptidoglycan/LPS O-acetylase OafA/YrhL
MRADNLSGGVRREAAADSAGSGIAPPPIALEPAQQTGLAARYESFKRVRFFRSLDGLRAISILAVIWHHTAAFTSDNAILRQGNKGVTLFFVISGFLIVTLLLRAKERLGTFSLSNFYGRRAFRIFPIFYAVLAAYTVLVLVVEKDAVARATFFRNLPAFATFTSNWFVDLDNPRVIFYFAWSLAAEEQFYLVWPTIEKVLRGAWPAVVALGALVATQAVAANFHESARAILGLRIVTSIPAAILMGVVLAHLLHRKETHIAVARVLGRRGSAVGAAAFLLGALAAAPRLGDAGDVLIAFGMMLLVGSCVIREDNDLAPALSFRPIAWIGTVSYGMYLLHMIAVNIARRLADLALGHHSPYTDFVIGSVLTIALASLSYVTFERYFLSLKERLFPAEKPTPNVERRTPNAEVQRVGS